MPKPVLTQSAARISHINEADFLGRPPGLTHRLNSDHVFPRAVRLRCAHHSRLRVVLLHLKHAYAQPHTETLLVGQETDPDTRICSHPTFNRNVYFDVHKIRLSSPIVDTGVSWSHRHYLIMVETLSCHGWHYRITVDTMDGFSRRF